MYKSKFKFTAPGGMGIPEDNSSDNTNLMPIKETV